MVREEQDKGGGDALWAALLLLPLEGRCGQWLLCATRRAEAAPSWGPKSLFPLLPLLPSLSLRFQYNFQLTSMSIEQVGQPDCWPITGNHSAPQLSAQGEGGRECEGVRPSLQVGRGSGFRWVMLQPQGGTRVGEQG